MAYPTFTFNNASGSDTAASGAGPATALSGTSASYSGSVFTLDGSPDLSGVATDGSHVIWVQTSTGRQFFTINAVNDGADTVTVDDAPAGTTSGLTWGLGGKRKTLDNTQSRLLFTADFKTDWIVELEDDQTITSSSIAFVSTAQVCIVSDTPGTKRTITQTANAPIFQDGGATQKTHTLVDLKLANSAGTPKTSAYGIDNTNAGEWHLLRCCLGDSTNKLYAGFDTSSHMTLEESEVAHCIDDGCRATSRELIIIDSWIHDNGDRGCEVNFSQFTVVGSVIENNGSDGIYCRSEDVQLFQGNVIDGNTGDGIDLTFINSRIRGAIRNNIITNNGGYGIRGGGSLQNNSKLVRYNNFGTGANANTSGDVLTIAKGDGNVNLDPQFTDAAGNDWSTGANMKAAGAPNAGVDTVGSSSSTYAYNDIGIQQEAAAGGSVIVIDD